MGLGGGPHSRPAPHCVSAYILVKAIGVWIPKDGVMKSLVDHAQVPFAY